MTQFRELKLLLAITAVGLFSLSVYNAVALAGTSSASAAYRYIVLCAMAFVWGMMNWLAYEDPVRYKEGIMVTIMGLMLISLLEVTILMSGHVPTGEFAAPWGRSISLEDAVWGEATVLAALGLLLFYFKPEQPIVEMKTVE